MNGSIKKEIDEHGNRIYTLEKQKKSLPERFLNAIKNKFIKKVEKDRFNKKLQ